MTTRTLRPTFLTLGAISVGLLLSGCTGMQILPESKKIDYRSAAGERLPSLVVPPDLTQLAQDGRYTVPGVMPRGTATFSEYAGVRRTEQTAVSTVVLPAVDRMRIERAGTQRWLVAGGTPEALWPTIREFWQETGFIINMENPAAGVMETDWAENRAKLPQDFIRSALGKIFDTLYSTAERDKFRTRLEPGPEPDTTEIYISHRGMYEVFITEGKDQTRWQPRPADPELEAEMLRRLMVRLGAEESRAQAMIAVGPREERARLTRTADGAGTLSMSESFDRTWRRVGLALDRVGFTVEDRDRSQGLYFVRYIDPEAESRKEGEAQGWLSRLNPVNLFGGRPEVGVTQQQYRIHIIGEGQNSRVRVLTREGGVDNSETARRILGLLHEQLK